MFFRTQSTRKGEIIPPHGEARRIGPTLCPVSETLNNKFGTARLEIIVVDDRSRDATPAIVEGFKAEIPELRAIRFPLNRSKGGAVRTGLTEPSGELVLERR
jgi:glycosyltransferase involved in cell wall biosynthesis